MNRFTGQTSQSELTSLANNMAVWKNGSLHYLAETTNLSLRAISDDLHPISDTNPSSDPIPAEYTSFPATVIDAWRVLTFEKYQGRMACRTGSHMTTHHCCANWFVRYFMRAFSKRSVRSKQLEAMVGNWIIGYVRGKLDNRQYGSLKGRSTTLTLIDVVHHWSNAFDDGNSVRSIFVG